MKYFMRVLIIIRYLLVSLTSHISSIDEGDFDIVKFFLDVIESFINLPGCFGWILRVIVRVSSDCF